MDRPIPLLLVVSIALFSVFSMPGCSPLNDEAAEEPVDAIDSVDSVDSVDAADAVGVDAVDAAEETGIEDDLEEIVVTASRTASRGPYWNAWFELGPAEEAPKYQPALRLEAEQEVALYIDLAGIRFSAEGVTSVAANSRLREFLGEVESDRVRFQLLAVVDQRYLDNTVNGISASSPMTVDVVKYRNFARIAEEGADASERTREEESVPVDIADSEFGLTGLTLRTRNRTGVTTIMVSIWANGKPIDEIEVPVCIGGEDVCDEPDFSPVSTLSGFDSLRLGDQMSRAATPDAAVHFVSLYDDSASIVGTFRCNACGWEDGEYLAWNLGRTSDELADFLEGTLQPSFESAAQFNDEATFQSTGRSLFRTLFRDESPQESQELQEAIVEALSIARQAQEGGTPSFFFRLVDATDTPPFLIPLSLLVIPQGDSEEYYVGEQFRVETPLPLQDYSVPEACNRDWVVLAPPSQIRDPALADARGRISEWLAQLTTWGGRATIYEEIEPFREWLDRGIDETQDPDDTVLMLLSHHEQNRLYFNANTQVPNITAGAIFRNFGRRSVVIINACGAASPGASEIAHEFNYYGVPTVIATSTTVDALMAGDFMAKFAELIEANAATDDYAVGQAVFDTVQFLSEQYGPEAFIYSVYGNGAARICGPSGI